MLNNIFNSSEKNFIFISLPSILVVLLPFFLITGPFLPDLAISICATLFLIDSTNHSLKKYYLSKFFLIFLSFWFILIISSLLSDNIIYSLSTSLFYIRFGVFSLSVWYLINHDERILKYLFYSFLIFFSILLADGYLQFFTGNNIFGWEIIGTRVSSFFKDELILGSYLSRLFPIFFAIFIWKLEKEKNFFFYSPIVIFILIEVLIFLSGERTAFFYLNLSAAFIIVLSKNFKRMRLYSICVSFLLMTLISYFQPAFKEKIVDQTLKQTGITGIFDYKNLKLFSSEHQNHYISAWRMFEDNKVIGIGTKLFRKNCNKERYKITFESCTTHPHNTYIQLLSETGIIGFTLVFSIFCTLVYYCLKHFYLKIFSKKIFFSDFQISLISAVIISLWPLVPSGNFFNNWLSVVYFFPVGILLWSFDFDKN